MSDYYHGQFDKKTCNDCFGCCCKKCGFTRIGFIFMFIFETFQLTLYWLTDQCPLDSFWIANNLYQSIDDRENFRASGGMFSDLYCKIMKFVTVFVFVSVGVCVSVSQVFPIINVRGFAS